MSWIRTYTGKRFNVADLDLKSICIEDIAHALSNACRFTGHVWRFYSVAQHCVLAHDEILKLGYGNYCAFHALLHDASEAYLSDIASPIKALLPDYKRIEYDIESAVSVVFNLSWQGDIKKKVKNIDMVMLCTEARDLMGDPQDWEMLKGIPKLPNPIIPLTSLQAEQAFLGRYFSYEQEPWFPKGERLVDVLQDS